MTGPRRPMMPPFAAAVSSVFAGSSVASPPVCTVALTVNGTLLLVRNDCKLSVSVMKLKFCSSPTMR